MARDRIDYGTAMVGKVLEGAFDVSEPTAGFYKMKLRSGGYPAGIRIWYGAPLDPIDGTELDRGHRWQALANDKAIDLERVWPRCGFEPITEKEYQYLSGLQAWAEKNAPSSPQANPHQRINLLTAPTPF